MSDSSDAQSPTPLRERGRDSSPRQIYNVLGSKGVSVEESLKDISKSKRNYSYILPWKLRSLTLMKRQLIHQITESEWMPGGIRWTQW